MEGAVYSNIEAGYYYLLRSTSEHNIHKVCVLNQAIKYGVWTSSVRNNEILANSYEDALKHNLPIYFFFTANKTNNFLGVAEMAGPFNAAMSFKYWQDENKWFGTIKLKWLFVRDIPFMSLSGLKEYIFIKQEWNLIRIVSRLW